MRGRFLELGRRDEARAAEGAWISTIHGFCARVLRTHALSAGIDPDFRVLDELEAERLAARRLRRRARGVPGATDADPERLELVAAYTPDRLRDMVRTAYSRLRSRGQRQPRLEEPPAAATATGERERLEAAARGAAAPSSARRRGRATVGRALERLERCAAVLDGLPPGGCAGAGASSTS